MESAPGRPICVKKGTPVSRFARPSSLDHALQDLLTRQGLDEGLNRLAALNRAWLQAAGPSWKGLSWVLGWRDEDLEVAVTSPAAATRLRFEAEAIRQRLHRQGWQGIQRIRARVQPGLATDDPSRGRRYSPEAAAAVAEAAGEIPDDGLRSALENLARHLADSPQDTGRGGKGT